MPASELPRVVFVLEIDGKVVAIRYTRQAANDLAVVIGHPRIAVVPYPID